MSAVTTMPRGGQLVTAEHASAIRSALKSSLYPGASDESVDMVLAYCQAAQLDPMTKPVHIVPVWIPEKKSGNQVVTPAGMRDVVMPGIELYRTKAHRTGEYAGQDEAEYGATVDEVLSGVRVRYPEWCKVTVYRVANGERVPYSAKVYWLEAYATAKRDTDAPNSMWKKRPFGQLEKCAEALALRKAFPEAVGAQPTAEEMEGKSLGVDEGRANVVEPQRAAIEQQRPALPALTEAEFAGKFPPWRELIRGGKKTHAQMLATLQSRYALTDNQIAQIETVEVAPPADDAQGDAE